MSVILMTDRRPTDRRPTSIHGRAFLEEI